MKTEKRKIGYKRLRRPQSSVLLGFLFATGLAVASCRIAAGNKSGETYFPEGVRETVVEKTLQSGTYSLVFIQAGSGYEVALRKEGDDLFSQAQPARITLRDTGVVATESYAGKEYARAYDKVVKEGKGFRAVAKVETQGGSIFQVEDRYKIRQKEVFVVHRTVRVLRAGDGEAGFASLLSWKVGAHSPDAADYEYFIPSVLYRNTSEMRPGSVASDLEVDRMYVKETRSGLPLAMLREKKSGHTLTLLHYKPEIGVGGHPGGGLPGEVNNDLQYGSIGYTLRPSLSVDFCYPCAEGPQTYEPVKRKDRRAPFWSQRYHSVEKGTVQTYSVVLIPDRSEAYNEAMRHAFGTAYIVESPRKTEQDMERIYRQNIALFQAEYREFGTGSVRAAGMPWSLDLPDGKNREGVSFQMGFVGQQIPVGYHLYRYGLDQNDPETKRKGKTMVDFWVTEAIMGTYFPTVWWDPADNATAGQRRDYPSFLRCFVDGMEGLLDACRISEAYREPCPEWNRALRRVASHLVEKQNEDGSFYRAYRPDGEVEMGGDRNTQGASKLNTPVAVRFLVKMYEHTGEWKYREAAVRAAEFSYHEIYRKLGKYVGGTPDNPNTVDKEAAIYALYCFNAAHELTGEAKYLEAAEHAALCAMSWTYCYDFALPNRDSLDLRKNPFTKGGISGFSVISTGHSGADNFISYLCYEMYKLYVKTGKELYLDMAVLLQNNTKSNTDFDGRMGYKYAAFMPEATNVADWAFRSVSVWLPWASIANIEPLVCLEEAFGKKDIRQLRGSLPQLRARLAAYGVGGKPLRR